MHMPPPRNVRHTGVVERAATCHRYGSSTDGNYDGSYLNGVTSVGWAVVGTMYLDATSCQSWQQSTPFGMRPKFACNLRTVSH